MAEHLTEDEQAPTTDLTTGTIHICTFPDGSRIFASGDQLMIWRNGTTVCNTPKRWIEIAEKGAPICGG